LKRHKNFFEKIIAYENIRLAWLKASKGKSKSTSVMRFASNLNENLRVVQQRLDSTTPGWGGYRHFTISDPKPRVISAAPFSERIMHHALMNVLEPVFERHLIYHTYACRKGKGTHAAVEFAFSKSRSGGFFLKYDVRKYFDSIDHMILKKQLRCLIKDQRVLQLLSGIIDSYSTVPGKGLPIGNLTSQYFANHYLSLLDHYIIEQLHPHGYARYMDDFILFFKEQQKAHEAAQDVNDFCKTHLALQLKVPVINKMGQGVPFLGFLIKPGGVFLLRKSQKRMIRRSKEIHSGLINGILSEEEAAARALSVNAAVKVARTYSFRMKIWHESSSNRVLRGGSWNNSANNMQVGNVNNNNPDNTNNNNGFRLARP
jgi:RNA-directed DNA polymerase